MNYFKFSKLAIGTTCCFFASVLFIMLMQVQGYLIIPAIICLIAGLVCLSIILYKRYVNKKQELFFDQEEIVMELANSKDGEKYVAEKNTYAKKLRKKIKSAKTGLIMPFIFTVCLAVVFFAFLVKIIVGLF